VDTVFKIDGGITGFILNLVDAPDNYTFSSKALIDFLYNFIVLVLLLEILGGK
jgi:hypothetical protein